MRSIKKNNSESSGFTPKKIETDKINDYDKTKTRISNKIKFKKKSKAN
jgi:hypothetical protein